MDLVKGKILTTSQLYEASLTEGFNDDPSQRKIVDHLTKLQRALNFQIKLQESYKTKIYRWFGIRCAQTNPKGLYIWGGVGRGKTHLMDLFYESLGVPKQRLHFHRFMAKVHRSLTKKKGAQDPLQSVAADFASQAKVMDSTQSGSTPNS